ncbi:3'-5' exoribonuclease [Romboutsia ilealis]|uniref:3'-5' exoribonuclease n=1 Tax=Romboutsia ilealis TaxID=1115758 RepID=UPI00272C0DAE|nr:3'-5' exoribonuclease [Romboutsia ilealis]
MKNIFIDCEMTSLDSNGELISLGALYIDDNGNERTFYAEFNDYDASHSNQWVIDNVISKLKFINYDFKNCVTTFPGTNTIKAVEMKGSTKAISLRFVEWIQDVGDRCIFVADVGHYDISMVFNMLGGAFSLPSNLSPAYTDLNMLIAIDKTLNVDQAFDLNREKLAGDISSDDKHNALFDARVARVIYYSIMKSN